MHLILQLYQSPNEGLEFGGPKLNSQVIFCLQKYLVLFSLEENLLHWMGNVNMTAEVLHLPLSICAPCPSLLLSPSLCALIAPTSPGICSYH